MLIGVRSEFQEIRGPQALIEAVIVLTAMRCGVKAFVRSEIDSSRRGEAGAMRAGKQI